MRLARFQARFPADPTTYSHQGCGARLENNWTVQPSLFGTEKKFCNKLSIFRPQNLQSTFNSIAFVVSRVKKIDLYNSLSLIPEIPRSLSALKSSRSLSICLSPLRSEILAQIPNAPIAIGVKKSAINLAISKLFQSIT